MRPFLMPLILTCSFLGFAAPAHAQSNEDDITITVPVTPADLQSREAVASLYRRIEHKAYIICSQLHDASASAAAFSMRDCRQQVLDRAMNRTSYAALAQYYAEQKAATATMASR